MSVTSTPRHVEVRDGLRQVKRLIPRPVKKLARHAARIWGTATARHRVLPDFLIIGTKRGGTTSLWNWLVGHPEVAPLFPAAQQMKSPHYFDINYERGERWYRSHFPLQSEGIWKSPLQSHGMRKSPSAGDGAQINLISGDETSRDICGEASPYYLYHPLAAERVHQAVPNVKVIVSLRNPVDRAYSHYWERRGGGFEPLGTFEEALQAEHSRLSGEAERIVADPTYYSAEHDNHSYIARGHYLEQLKPWLKRFTQEQILILRFEDLKKDEAAVWRQVQEFLGLTIVDTPPAKRYNRLPAPPIAATTRERLTNYYAPHNQKLSEELGMKFNWNT